MGEIKMQRSVGARVFWLGLTLLAVMLLGACGQKGPLKLPPPSSAAEAR